MNRVSVDSYLTDGCGRCSKYQTPDCKVLLWTDPLVELRAQLLASGLEETMKWGLPCYTYQGKNVILLVSTRSSCALSFPKGALLTDDEGLLELPGPNSRAGRVLRFTSVEQVRARSASIARFVAEAIQLQSQGARVEKPEELEPVPEELQQLLDQDPALAEAFEALTPGRRRSHVLHVSGAKQAGTRARRAAKCAIKILEGRGFNER